MTTPAELNFGKIAISHKFMTPVQVNECLEVQRKMREFGLDEKKLGEVAIEKGFISSHQRTLILNIQRAEVEKLRKKRELELAVIEQEARELATESDEEPEPKAAAPSAKPAGRRSSRKASAIRKRPSRRSSARARPSSRTPKRDSAIRQAPAREIDPERAAQLDEERRIRREEERELKMQSNQMKMVVGAIMGVAALIVIAVIALSVNWGGDPQSTDNIGDEPGVSERSGKDKEKRAAENQAANLFGSAQRCYNEGDYRGARALLKQIFQSPGMRATSYLTRAQSLDNNARKKIDEAERAGPVEPVNPNNTANGVQPRISKEAQELYTKIVMETFGLRREKQLWDAVVALDQFPDRYQDTPEWTKVQEEKKKLRLEIGQLLEADIREIKAYLAKKMFKKAKETAASIRIYASSEQVDRIQQLIAKGIEDMTAEEIDTGLDEGEMLQKLSTAKAYFERGFLKKARKIYETLARDDDFMKKHPQIIRDLDIIARVTRLYKAVGEAILMLRKSTSASIGLYKRGRVKGKVITVNLNEVHMKDQYTGDDIKFHISEIDTKDLIILAQKRMNPDHAETDIAIGLVYLMRDQKEKARERFFQAMKRRRDKPLRIDLLIEMTDPKADGIRTPPRRVNVMDFSETVEGKAIEEARKAFREKDYKTAYRLLMDARRKYDTSAAWLLAEREINDMLEKCAAQLKKASALFAGKYIDMGDGTVRVYYDWSDETQLGDWKEYSLDTVYDLIPYPWELVDQEIKGRGSKVYLWNGIIDGDVTIEFEAVGGGECPSIQATLCDDGEGVNYLFGVGVKRLGPKRNSITHYVKKGTNKVLVKESANDIKVGQRYIVKIEKVGSKLRLWVDGKLCVETENDDLVSGHVGLFAGGSGQGVLFDNVKITGKLSKKWLRRHKRSKK
ncbi:MAG: hypothetical protein E3J72_06775 [Planctomycetota bacterium]|nr:MAG: hypothetical protein E3J72_06775 [Planctomycetota bacterium]